MKYAVHLTPDVEDDIFNQYAYIAVEKQQPQNAEAWFAEAYEATTTLDALPNRCGLALENEHKDYEVRHLTVKGFTFLFTVFEDKQETWVIGTRGRGMEINPERLPDNVRAVADELREAEKHKRQDNEREQDQGMGR